MQQTKMILIIYNDIILTRTSFTYQLRLAAGFDFADEQCNVRFSAISDTSPYILGEDSGGTVNKENN